MKKKRQSLVLFLIIAVLLVMPSCGKAEDTKQSVSSTEEVTSSEMTASEDASAASSEMTSSEKVSSEKTPAEEAEETPAEETESLPEEPKEDGINKSICILFTGDIHFYVNDGFGLSGLGAIRESLESMGFTTILVDNGDAIQGSAVGKISKGETMIELMNSLHYDVAIPGNHEFDYGMDKFLAFTEMADFPYISCNFNKEGELVFEPYTIIEAGGRKIGFVGVTTPTTIDSAKRSYFQNNNGEYIYGFLGGDDGKELYQAVQSAVDAARAEGADYVYLMSHLGLNEKDHPFTFADVIEHTNGIDAILDAHTHESEQIIVNNKDGEPVMRCACGALLSHIGYSYISADQGIMNTSLWAWPNNKGIGEKLNEKVAEIEVALTINDPVEKYASGNPVRIVRRAETNLGDLCADAVRDAGKAEIGLVNGGAIRSELRKGEIIYSDIINVFPFDNKLCVIEASGQQILDALEWGTSIEPDECGGFLQVSGLEYDIDVSVPTPCIKNEKGLLTEIKGARRVKNVTVGDEPIDPERIYTVAGFDYCLLRHGNGQTAFDDCNVIREGVEIDSQILIKYINKLQSDDIMEEYSDPYGQGRIRIIGK